MNTEVWRWLLGLIYIVAVATIWVAAGFVVQSVVDGGVSPFLVTYVCNALLMIYIPVVEVWHYLEDSVGCTWFWSSNKNVIHAGRSDKEEVLLGQSNLTRKGDDLNPSEFVEHGEMSEELVSNNHLDAKGRWTRTKTARVSLLLCPFWFLSYLCSNLSLKYTSVTSNTVLNSTSSLFTFLLSLIFLGERFTLLKLVSILLCFGGTVIVSLGDMESESSVIDTKPLLGDILALASACLYASFITIIRKRIPDEDEKCGRVSMAQLLGYLGLFNLLIFLPVALVLNITNLEPFHIFSWKQFGLLIGKGLLDNVMSDYLWAKAVLLTTPTVATAGLTIEVPMAAIVDSVTGHAPNLMDYLGGAAVMVGFVGISMPSYDFHRGDVTSETESENVHT